MLNYFAVVIMVPPISERGRRNNKEDMISELSDCIIHSYFNLSGYQNCCSNLRFTKEMERYWKQIPSLTFTSTEFSTSDKLSIFISSLFSIIIGFGIRTGEGNGLINSIINHTYQ
ncbi:hypothetical protein MtrunA17_Chr1g0170161 [Medicago truncatula]|uniref:Uncharacterized protein n=1 Tax=Medicago truncatula TaxID=3880 RepID=A0A396JKQ7_MEDTR|nr:hypothetical protein MtrunA17_Chr1g0170161 [Medicago truncatula]